MVLQVDAEPNAGLAWMNRVLKRMASLEMRQILRDSADLAQPILLCSWELLLLLP